jgi:hypothetical protein
MTSTPLHLPCDCYVGIVALTRQLVSVPGSLFWSSIADHFNAHRLVLLAVLLLSTVSRVFIYKGASFVVFVVRSRRRPWWQVIVKPTSTINGHAADVQHSYSEAAVAVYAALYDASFPHNCSQTTSTAPHHPTCTGTHPHQPVFHCTSDRAV